MVLVESRWHPEAIEDAETARNGYAERSRLAARDFLVALDGTMTTVAEAPDRWPARADGCRHCLFASHFPFSLVYRLRDGVVEVVAVAHHRRKPGHWAAR